jgi:nucleoside-diphosphate kinase
MAGSRDKLEEFEFVAEQERTLVIIKPDGVQRGLVGEIIGRLEKRGLKIVAMKLEVIESERAERHYGEHAGKPFYNGLVEYITSGPVVTMVLEGPQAIAATRATIGSTRPVEAALGTIRGDLALMVGRNLVHGSDSAESAAREVELFFGADAVRSWDRDADRWVYE